MKHRYKIKLLSGPLAGRQLLLPEGSFTIGGDDPDLDIALEDNGKAVLTVTEDGVALHTDTGCWIDGVPAKPAPPKVPPGAVVDIGGLALILAEGDQDVPVRRVPARRDGRRGSWSTGLAYACLITLLSGSAGAAIWVYGAMRQGATTEGAADWMDDWRARARQQGLRLVKETGSLPTLEGTCKASVERKVLLQTLREHDVMFRDNSLCQDELVRNVQAALALHGFGDAVVRPGETLGSVTIAGRIHADARWQKTVAMLSTMHGLTKWAVHDPVTASVKTLIDMLRGSGLIGKLSVARERGMVLITGVLDDGSRRTLEAVLQAFADTHPEGPKTIFQNIPTTSIQAGIFPSPIVSFGGSGDLTFLDLANGTRLKVGSRLPSGHVIAGIDRNGIDLERDGELMHLPLEL
jgi:type III secretion protein D